MATIFGTVDGEWASFGVSNTEIDTITMSTKSTSYDSEQETIKDEKGETILVAKFDRMDKFSFDATIIKSGHPQDTANGGIDIRDGFITINDAHGNVRKIIMDSLTINEENTTLVKISGEGTFYASVADVVTLNR